MQWYNKSIIRNSQETFLFRQFLVCNKLKASANTWSERNSMPLPHITEVFKWPSSKVAVFTVNVSCTSTCFCIDCCVYESNTLAVNLWGHLFVYYWLWPVLYNLLWPSRCLRWIATWKQSQQHGFMPRLTEVNDPYFHPLWDNCTVEWISSRGQSGTSCGQKWHCAALLPVLMKTRCAMIFLRLKFTI